MFSEIISKIVLTQFFLGFSSLLLVRLIDDPLTNYGKIHDTDFLTYLLYFFAFIWTSLIFTIPLLIFSINW